MAAAAVMAVVAVRSGRRRGSTMPHDGYCYYCYDYLCVQVQGGGSPPSLIHKGSNPNPSLSLGPKQARGGGSLLSFETASVAASQAILDETELFKVHLYLPWAYPLWRRGLLWPPSAGTGPVLVSQGEAGER